MLGSCDRLEDSHVLSSMLRWQNDHKKKGGKDLAYLRSDRTFDRTLSRKHL